MATYTERPPTNWVLREALREKGQFWTPDWVAQAMVSYVIGETNNEIFDPAFGKGAFCHAAKHLAEETGRPLHIGGTELDPAILVEAQVDGLTAEDVAGVQITDFVLAPPEGLRSGIVGNPPYIRHHRLSEEVKVQLKEFAKNLVGTALDGRAGYHIYFLLRALVTLAPGGRLAFIMPADTVEGKFAVPLWEWITTHFRLDAVVTFNPEASPFPGVDTNAIVFMISNQVPVDHLMWARCQSVDATDLKAWVTGGFGLAPGQSLTVQQRNLTEGLQTGLSRPPELVQHTGKKLGDFVRVMRGIATGDNDFFFLTRSEADKIGIPDEFLRVALGRTRDVPGDVITTKIVKDSEEAGRPTLLFAPDRRPIGDFPESVQAYLKTGIEKGLPERSLIAQRKPWYRMEVRAVPQFLFAYLGRRNARFIRNQAGVLPLTSFLCVYALDTDPKHVKRLWKMLAHPDTIANLFKVGKSYGGGAIKVEPRSLEQLPIPENVIVECDLTDPEAVEAPAPVEPADQMGMSI